MGLFDSQLTEKELCGVFKSIAKFFDALTELTQTGTLLIKEEATRKSKERD